MSHEHTPEFETYLVDYVTEFMALSAIERVANKARLTDVQSFEAWFELEADNVPPAERIDSLSGEKTVDSR